MIFWLYVASFPATIALAGLAMAPLVRTPPYRGRRRRRSWS